MAEPQPSEMLTVAETAALLHRSTEQVRRYLREGVLLGRRLGGQWFIARTDADVFAMKRSEGSDFRSRLAAGDSDPLADAIGIGGSGGGEIAAGKIHYLGELSGRQRL
jgi:hypothetical protein